MKAVSFITLFIFSIFISACSTSMFVGFDKENQNLSKDILTNNCDFNVKQLKYTQTETGTTLKIDDPLYYGNILGYRAFLCGELQKSIEMFDIAENNYRFSVDEKNIAKKAGQEIIGALANKNFFDYEGQFYERILNNVYKALAYMELKDYAGARVEFRRALERQERTKDEFRKYISKKTAEQSSELKKTQDANSNVDYVKEQLNSQNKAHYRAYKNFTNPFANYMASLFFVLDKDYGAAKEYMRDMINEEHNQYFIEDLNIVNANFSPKSLKYRKNKNKSLKHLQISNNGKYIWLIYENGFARPLKEFKFNLPILGLLAAMSNDDTAKMLAALGFTGISIAVLDDSVSAYDYLFLSDYQTTILSNMDNVVSAEYDATLTYRITQSVVSTITKATTTTLALKENGYLGLGVGLASSAVNHADTRYFVGLPKNYQIARIPNTGVLQIYTPNKEILVDEKVNINKNIVVYIKVPYIGVQYVKVFEER